MKWIIFWHRVQEMSDVDRDVLLISVSVDFHETCEEVIVTKFILEWVVFLQFWEHPL